MEFKRYIAGIIMAISGVITWELAEYWWSFFIWIPVWLIFMILTENSLIYNKTKQRWKAN